MPDISIRNHYQKQNRHTRNLRKATKLTVVTCSAIWYEAQQYTCKMIMYTCILNYVYMHMQDSCVYMYT